MIRAGRAAAFAAQLVGAAVLVAGTFAPWLKSGEVTRDSYRTAGLLQRLLAIHGAVGAALDALPLLALLCAVAALLLILGWRRTAAGLFAVLAVAMGALAIAALLAPASPVVSVDSAGPIVVLAAAALILAGGIASVGSSRADKHYRDTAVHRAATVDTASSGGQ